MNVFSGRSANDVWRQAAEAVRGQVQEMQGSRGGDTKELQDVLFSIEDPTQRWTTVRQPPMNPAFAIAEVVWIVNGSNESAFLNTWNPGLPKFQGEGATYYGAYGWRLREAFGFDQIGQAYHALRANPETRQVVLQIWDPSRDLPLNDGRPRSPDIPCNVCAMLKIRDGRLQWTQVMRSNDLVRGLPHNLVQFTYLQELMAGWLDLEIGTYTHLSDSLHVYENELPNLDVLGEDLGEDQAESERWRLGFDETRKVFWTSTRRWPRCELLAMVKNSSKWSCRHNCRARRATCFFIVGSDLARRNDWPEVAVRLMRECTDGMMVGLLQAWYRRKKFLVDNITTAE